MTRPRVRPLRRIVVVLLAAVTLLSGWTTPAGAAEGRADKLAVLARWTQTSTASYAGWDDARAHRDRWASHDFDWSTDNCSASPDQPLGFDFRLACQRHDFGYRDYKAAGLFADHKRRLDDAFHADLKRRCGTYPRASRPACYALAWTYYTAVKAFGRLITIDDTDLDRAARRAAQSGTH